MGLQELAEFSKRLGIAVDTLSNALQPALERLKRFAEVAEKLGPILKTYLDQVERIYKELPERQRASLEIMAKDGWYPDLEGGYVDIFKIAELLHSGNVETAREHLCKHFDFRAEEMKAGLEDWFPERAEVLSEAVDAHLNGKYALSVPVFLAQADGICQQRFGVQLYSKQRNGIPKLATTIEAENFDPLLSSLFYPIITAMPLTANQNERVELGDILNRHAVLHGEVSNYNSRLNSCRSLSLLFYTAYIFRESTELQTIEENIKTATEPEEPE